MVADGHNVTCYNRHGNHVSGVEFDGEKLDSYKGVKIKAVPTINRKGLTAMCWIPKMCRKKIIVTIHGVIIGTFFGYC